MLTETSGHDFSQRCLYFGVITSETRYQLQWKCCWFNQGWGIWKLFHKCPRTDISPRCDNWPIVEYIVYHTW